MSAFSYDCFSSWIYTIHVDPWQLHFKVGQVHRETSNQWGKVFFCLNQTILISWEKEQGVIGREFDYNCNKR